jgi:flagellar biosynthetic protein FliO
MMPAWVNRIQQWYAAASRRQKVQAGLLALSLIACLALAFSGGAAPQTTAGEFSSLYFVGVAVKLGGVLLMIVGFGVLAMRWARNPRRLGRGGQMKVAESIRLSPKQALHLVQVGNQYFLVGATDQNIGLISEVNLPTPAEEEQPIPIGQDFSHLLQGFLQVKANGKG